MTAKYDIKKRLMEYFPVFFELLGDNKLDWKTIEKRFGQKLEEHKKKFDKTGQPIIVEASLFHIITASKEGNDKATRLLNFIIKIFEELIIRLDYEERKLIKKNLYDLLTNLDMKYLNFLGELCVLNHIKRNTDLQLIKAEQPLNAANKNGAKIDFIFAEKLTEKKLPVEIVNLHLSEENTSTDEKINNLLEQKLKKKLNKKGIRTMPEFYLVPVMWGPVEAIKRLVKYYENFGPKFQNTSVPVCFVSFSDSQGNQSFKFGSIDTIFK